MSLESVREFLAERGYADRVLTFDISSATVELAARAVGVPEAQIAGKYLVAPVLQKGAGGVFRPGAHGPRVHTPPPSIFPMNVRLCAGQGP